MGLLVKHNASELLVSLSAVEFSQNIGGFGKFFFTDHRTANTIKLFVATNGNLSGLPFSEKVAAKGNFRETTW